MNLDDLLPSNIKQAWDTTSPASDFSPLPAGTYEMQIVSGQLGESRTGKPRYAVKWQVCSGEHAGRFVWQDFWLTQAGLPMAKRDLAKLGISQLNDLQKPLQGGSIFSVEVSIRQRDNGKKYNEVKRFSFLRTEEADPFAPKPEVERALGEEDGFLDPKKRQKSPSKKIALADITPDNLTPEEVRYLNLCDWSAGQTIRDKIQEMREGEGNV